MTCCNQIYCSPIHENRCFHPLATSVPLPGRMNNPFSYEPNLLCVATGNEIKRYVDAKEEWRDEIHKGKMFGVLIVRNQDDQPGYLCAYSGQILGKSDWKGFVPPIFDYLQPNGYFKKREAEITKINHELAEILENEVYLSAEKAYAQSVIDSRTQLDLFRNKLQKLKQLRDQNRMSNGNDLAYKESLDRESQFQHAELRRLKIKLREEVEKKRADLQQWADRMENKKNERKRRSDDLQRWLFSQFVLLNALGEKQTLREVFERATGRIPPSGSGECCAPKLLQYAYLHRLTPVSIAEFWLGGSPKAEIRHSEQYYPACRGRCLPILSFMLRGLKVDNSPSVHVNDSIRVVDEDDDLCVIVKPAGMLSVPGKDMSRESVYSLMKQKYPFADGPLIVHRLDMATSGLMIVAKTKAAHQALQSQFANHEVRKKYIALLDGIVSAWRGTISLPLCADVNDRPRQLVDFKNGKTAITKFEVVGQKNGKTRVALYPVTGRTHQLRVHCAHQDGLGCPILGDALYGRRAERLYLNAEEITFRHPVTGQIRHYSAKAF